MDDNVYVKHKTIDLYPGFYAIRYTDRGDGKAVAILQSLNTSGKQVRINLIGAERGGKVMLSPETPIALCYVEGDVGKLAISLLLARNNRNSGVVFDVERLPERVPNISALCSSLVFLSGHVEWKGDVKVSPGKFLGASKGSARIEGFAINWLKRKKDIDIKYGCTFGQQQESSTALSGGFVGSRRQSAPITSLWVALEGSAADQYDLQYTAVFAKAGSVSGRQAEVVSGIDASDYLVGLWVSVDDAGSVPPDIPSLKGRKVKELKTFRA